MILRTAIRIFIEIFMKGKKFLDGNISIHSESVGKQLFQFVRTIFLKCP